jgi:putative transcriptional regulator
LSPRESIEPQESQLSRTVVNLSFFKNGRARAIRFRTLTELCKMLGCEPGDHVTYEE